MPARLGLLLALAASGDATESPPAGAPPPPVAVERRTLAWEGGVVGWLEAGPEDGPGVLLLHGARYSAATWQELGTLELLAGGGYRAVALDLPGFGASRDLATAPEGFLERLLPRLGLTRPVVVAPSMSGRFALPLAIRRPAALAGLVVVAPAGVAEHRAALGSLTAPTLVVWGSEDAVVPLAVGRQLAAELPAAELRVLEGAGHACYRDRPAEFHAALLAFLAQRRGGAADR